MKTTKINENAENDKKRRKRRFLTKYCSFFIVILNTGTIAAVNASYALPINSEEPDNNFVPESAGTLIFS